MPERAVLTLTVDTSEGRRRFGVYADATKDITPVLREFDRYKRARIDELFSTGGHGAWPERSQRSEQRGAKRVVEATQRAPLTMQRKLGRELRKAEKKLSRLDPLNSTTRRLSSGRNAVARRAFALRAFEQAAAGVFEQVDTKQAKVLARLAPRWERAQGRATKTGALLGSLSRTIESKIAGGLLTIDSSWDSPAPAALQEGGTVGHGAKLPPREWLAWDPQDIDVLADLFEKRAMLAWRS